MRKAELERNTKETQIKLSLALDGKGESNLKADLQNCQIIVSHHANFIKENVPASAEVEEPKAEEAPKK